MKILLLSHTADFGAFKVGSHHLAREFAKLGHAVVHLSTPVSRPQVVLRRGTENRIALARSGPVKDEVGVVHATGVVPVPLRLVSQRRAVARLIAEVGASDADLVFIDEPLMGPVIPQNHRGVVIYRPTDLYLHGVRASRQAHVLPKADGVVGTSRPVVEALALPTGTPRAVIENGVEFERFARVSETERRGAVYVGALDERFDWQAIRVMAEAEPELEIDLYGPVAHTPAVPPSVRVHGPVPYRDVPGILASAQLGLLPFTPSALNAGRSPMKFYEYLAAGLNIVASETPVLRARAAPGAVLYRTRRDTAQALRDALELSSPNLRGRERASRQGWPQKARELLEFACRTEEWKRREA